MSLSAHRPASDRRHSADRGLAGSGFAPQIARMTTITNENRTAGAFS